MGKRRKSRDDYNETIRCAECGSETGPFVMDTDDDDIICQDCLLDLPSEDRLLFDVAVENARNLEVRERNGWAWITCAHCGADIDQFNLDDGGSSIEDATALLEEDKEHECEEEEEGE